MIEPKGEGFFLHTDILIYSRLHVAPTQPPTPPLSGDVTWMARWWWVGGGGGWTPPSNPSASPLGPPSV